MLLLQLLQIAQHLLRRFWLPIRLQPVGRLSIRLSWLLLTRHDWGRRCRWLPGWGLAWLIRLGDFAIWVLIGSVVVVAIRRRARSRSWSYHRCRNSRRFAGALPHGQHDSNDGTRLLLRTKQNVVIMRAVQQRRQDVSWSPRPKVDVNSLAGKTRSLDGCARGILHRPQHVAQGAVLGTDAEQPIAKSDLRLSGRCLGGQRAENPGWRRLLSRRRWGRRGRRGWRFAQQNRH